MQTLATGRLTQISKGLRNLQALPRQAGFTLLELLVVLAIVAIASGGVVLSLQDQPQTQLRREAQRLAALLETARAQSRMLGVPVRWRGLTEGFVFDGLPPSTQLPQAWLDPDSAAQGQPVLTLGPEPIIAAQSVVLYSRSHPDAQVRLASDGVRAFEIADADKSAPSSTP